MAHAKPGYQVDPVYSISVVSSIEVDLLVIAGRDETVGIAGSDEIFWIAGRDEWGIAAASPRKSTFCRC